MLHEVEMCYYCVMGNQTQAPEKIKPLPIDSHPVWLIGAPQRTAVGHWKAVCVWVCALVCVCLWCISQWRRGIYYFTCIRFLPWKKRSWTVIDKFDCSSSGLIISREMAAPSLPIDLHQSLLLSIMCEKNQSEPLTCYWKKITRRHVKKVHFKTHYIPGLDWGALVLNAPGGHKCKSISFQGYHYQGRLLCDPSFVVK